MGGANGLIVAFVVAVWAAYFVPLVLRRYDDASTASSLESLSPLSRVIARSQHDGATAETEEDDVAQTPEGASGVQPRADSTDFERVQALDREALASIEKPARPQVSRRAAVVAAKRRRRTLLTLLTALLVVGGLVVFSVVAPVWLAIPAGLVMAWLVACRVQVRGERGISRQRKPGQRPTWLRKPNLPRRQARQGAGSSARSSSRASAAHEEETVIVQLDDIEPERPHVMEEVALTEDALDDQVVIAVPSLANSGEAVWDPLPVTLPTYVTKPRAGRTVRTIDFDAPGAWTSGHIEGEDVELPGRGHDTQGAPRRASGE